MTTNSNPSASASPSASPTKTATSSPTTAPARRVLELALDRATTTPGQPATVSIHGAPGAPVELLAYSRPSTDYAVVRRGTTDSDGALSFTVSPGTNTRLYAHYAGGPAETDSPSTVLQVRTAISLSAYRDAVRQYHFQGRTLPKLGGQLVTLYRVDGAGREIRTATTRTDASGIWRIDRHFTGSGQFTLVARTGNTLNNAAGRSNQRATVIH